MISKRITQHKNTTNNDVYKYAFNERCDLTKIFQKQSGIYKNQ